MQHLSIARGWVITAVFEMGSWVSDFETESGTPRVGGGITRFPA